MTISRKRSRLLAQMEEHLGSLDRSQEALAYSFQKCSSIGAKQDYDLEEQENFEALTSRFSRTADILTQKVLKTFYMLMHEDIITIIDGANFLEKLEILKSADDMLNIRELRNQIAHEYVATELPALFSDVLRYVPMLEEISASVKRYIQEKFRPVQSGPQTRIDTDKHG